MRSAAIGVTALAFVAAVPGSAQTQAEKAHLAAVHDRGVLLYSIDRAAWVATDDFRAKADLRADPTLRGYIVERAPQGFTVTFFAEEAGRLVRAYVANVARAQVTRSQVFDRRQRTPLTPMQIRLAKARELPSRLGFRSCTGRFNVTPIPPASVDAPMDVYFLSPQVRRDEFPLGGHFRVKLAPNGKLLASRKFTNACLSMPASPQNRVLGVAHLLDPVPTEMHVFTALSARIPVMVTIGDRRWHVDDRSITLVEAGRNNGRRGR